MFEPFYYKIQEKNFSRRRAHFKRRGERDPDVIESFRAEGQEILNTIAHDHIVNCDETFWKIINLRLYTWAHKNSDNIIVDPQTNDKLRFSAVATILANGRTLPFVLIARGTSDTVEKIGLVVVVM